MAPAGQEIAPSPAQGQPSRSATHRSQVMPIEILGDGTMAGVIGASALALFMLLVDAARREALFTPSVMGSALLRGIPPSEATGIDLGMVAGFSVLHGAAFIGVGILAAWATAMRHASVATFTLAIALFAVLELGFLFTTAVLEPALLEAVGVAPATVGNLLAAIAMAAYLHRWPHDSIEEREAHQRGHDG
jgi:uncharacterized membrane-anchored protein YitT (DUF2179 family)